MENEIWKDILGYEGRYQVSSLGRVKSLKRLAKIRSGSYRLVRERILTQCVYTHYYVVPLNDGIKRKTFNVHKLVAIAFLGHEPCGYKLVVDHINNNKLDNRFSNLRLITQRENTSQKSLKNTSQYVGVIWNKKVSKWQSHIRIKKDRKFLGSFNNEYDAHLSYQKELKNINNV